MSRWSCSVLNPLFSPPREREKEEVAVAVAVTGAVAEETVCKRE